MNPSLLGLALTICLLFAASSACSDEAANQARFSAAMVLVGRGQPAEAVPILQALYDETKAPRVRLELARALLLSGRKGQARKDFVEAYEDNPPAPVKSTIANFIEQIDRANGEFSFGLGLGRYGNPLHQPNASQIYLDGYILKLEENPKYHNVFGVNGFGSYNKQFDSIFDISTYASYTDLAQPSLNSANIQASVGATSNKLSSQLRVGVDDFQMKQQSYTLAYLYFIHSFALSKRIRFNPSAKLGYWNSQVADSLSGLNYQFKLPLTYMIDPSKNFSIGPKVDIHEAGFREDGYRSIGLDIESRINFRYVNIDFLALPAITEFDGIDPFWGKTRSDQGVFILAQFSSELVRYKGFLPSIGFQCSAIHSNISFYSQDGCDLTTSVRKLF